MAGCSWVEHQEMVPVVVPAGREYALVGLECVWLVAACWCWHTVGSWNSRRPASCWGVGCVVSVSLVKRAPVGVRGVG